MIKFKRVNLCDKESPLYSWDSIQDRHNDILVDMKRAYFSYLGRDFNSLCITPCRFKQDGWKVAGTPMESVCKFTIIAKGFKTKKAAIDFVNNNFQAWSFSDE